MVIGLGTAASLGASIPVWVWVIVSICVGLVVACFQAWREERQEKEKAMQELAKLEARLQPKVKISCDKGTTKDLNYFRGPRIIDCLRVVVSNIAEQPLHNCQARIVKIEKNGQLIFSDNAILTFEPPGHADAQSKTIKPQSREFVNTVLFGDDKPQLGTLFESADVKPHFKELFIEPSEYILSMEISGTPPMVTEKFPLKFTWTGDSRTATLDKL